MNVCKWSRSTSMSQSPVNDVSRRTNLIKSMPRKYTPHHYGIPTNRSDALLPTGDLIFMGSALHPSPTFNLKQLKPWFIGLRHKFPALHSPISDVTIPRSRMWYRSIPVCFFTPINLWNLKNTHLTHWICVCIELHSMQAHIQRVRWVNKCHLWPWSLRTHGRPLHCLRWSLRRVFPVCI